MAGDDARKAEWMDVSEDNERYRNLYASHKMWVDQVRRHLGAFKGAGTDHLVAPEASAFRAQLSEILHSDENAPMATSPTLRRERSIGYVDEDAKELIAELHTIATNRQLVTIFSSPLDATASNEAQATRFSDVLLDAILRSYRLSRHVRQQQRAPVCRGEQTCAEASCFRRRSLAETLAARAPEKRVMDCNDWSSDSILGGGLLQLVVRWGRADLVKRVLTEPELVAERSEHRLRAGLQEALEQGHHALVEGATSRDLPNLHHVLVFKVHRHSGC